MKTHLPTLITHRRWPALLAVVGLVAAGLALGPSVVSSAQVAPTGMVCTDGPTFNLATATGHISTPDGNSILMWSYKPDGGQFQLPGPVLCVDQGDTVTINLTNPTKADGGPGETVSMVFPGQSGVAASGGSCPAPEDCLLAPAAAPPGGSVTYTFTAGQPGTYLYESGTIPEKQIQMGLYGAIVVRPDAGDEFAYNDPSTRFNPEREYLILLNEIDPALHRAVERGQPYDLNQFNDDYWTLNGRSFPDTIADNGVPWLPDQPYGALVRIEAYDPATNPDSALIRYANVGMVNHPFHPHGNHLRVVARDGRLLRGPGGEDTSFEDFTRTIGAGQTYDLLLRWDDVDPWISGGGPVPVTIPGLQNLVFKDDTSFYSGDPRLGRQGSLPVGVTSYNECGEFYFPWHSHALFEFTNFDEGFGGMATLLRVDPPGGCAAEDSMHIGNLDGSSTTIAGGRWRATVAVTAHDVDDAPVSGATVTGTWSAGDTNGRTLSCTTDGTGRCTVQSGRLSLATNANVTFTITDVTHAGLTYLPSANHDPDGDSTGTSIVVDAP